jgi:glycosyltransferase involved in cell wall biosynthesis
VIFDGASTDGTQDLIAAMTAEIEPRDMGVPIFFCSEPDKNLYDAMNKAVRMCRGNYLIFLNSDDLIADERVLERLAAVVDRSGCDFVYGTSVQVLPDGRRHEAKRTNLNAVLQRMPFSHNAVLIKRDVFQAMGGHNFAFPVAADYDLVLRMVAAGYTGLSVPFPVSLYQTRGVSSEPDLVAQDYSRVWHAFFKDLGLARSYSESDFLRWYYDGHFPLKVVWPLLWRKNIACGIRRAALHSATKSLKRAAQPWRSYGRRSS